MRIIDELKVFQNGTFFKEDNSVKSHCSVVKSSGFVVYTCLSVQNLLIHCTQGNKIIFCKDWHLGK